MEFFGKLSNVFKQGIKLISDIGVHFHSTLTSKRPAQLPHQTLRGLKAPVTCQYTHRKNSIMAP